MYMLRNGSVKGEICKQTNNIKDKHISQLEKVIKFKSHLKKTPNKMVQDGLKSKSAIEQ